MDKYIDKSNIALVTSTVIIFVFSLILLIIKNRKDNNNFIRKKKDKIDTSDDYIESTPVQSVKWNKNSDDENEDDKDADLEDKQVTIVGKQQ